jgi:dihydrolipoamide dehydrogenase
MRRGCGRRRHGGRRDRDRFRGEDANMANTYEAIVIGGGPGGYPAAIRLAQLGVKTLCVEKEYLGGVCLNWGCIPSKALIAASKLADKVKTAGYMGVVATDVHIDVPKMQQWKEGIVKKLTGGVKQLITSNGGDIVMGTGRLTGPKTVEVTAADGTKTSYTATRGIVVATGASVIQIPGFETDGDTLITAREAVSLQAAPESMVVIGGGVIGLELGMVYMKLGTKVTVVELMDQILPGTDNDVVRVIQKHLKQGGVEVLTSAKAKSCKVASGKAVVTVEHAGATRDIEAEKVLVAVGFKPNSKDLGLEQVGVQLDPRGHLIVDSELRTSVRSIFAVGDVTGAPYLAHKATHQGEIVAEIIAGHRAAVDFRAMPAAIFTDPEIATVGLTETEAKSQGKKVRIGKFPFGASGRAMAVGETDGFVKVIIDEDDHQVLGVTIVGPEAADLISEASLGIEMGAFAEDIALTVHPHPTLGESVMEAFKHALGEAVHIMNK